MASFYLTHAARADLKEIGRYTKRQWGVVQRDKYLTMLDGCFQDLAIQPLRGQDCSDIRAGYRKYNAGSHVIFYRQAGDAATSYMAVWIWNGIFQNPDRYASLALSGFISILLSCLLLIVFSIFLSYRHGFSNRGRIGGGIADGVLDVRSEVILNEPGIRALVGEGKAAGMAEHVGMGGQRQPGLFAIAANGRPDGAAIERAAPFTDEEGYFCPTPRKGKN